MANITTTNVLLTNYYEKPGISHLVFLCLKRDGNMKKWKDANEVLKMVHELPNRQLRDLDAEMKKKPNFDHHKNKCRVDECKNYTRTESKLCAKHIESLIK